MTGAQVDLYLAGYLVHGRFPLGYNWEALRRSPRRQAIALLMGGGSPVFAAQAARKKQEIARCHTEPVFGLLRTTPTHTHSSLGALVVNRGAAALTGGSDNSGGPDSFTGGPDNTGNRCLFKSDGGDGPPETCLHNKCSHYLIYL